MSWLDRVPEAQFYQYPWLLVARASTNFKIGNYELANNDLSEVERVVSNLEPSDEMVLRIRGHAAAIRSYLAELREDTTTAIQQAEAALALLSDKDIKLRSYVLIRWANCLAWLGDFERAIPAYEEAGEASKLVGDGQSAIIALSEVAVVQMFAGNLRQATDSINDIHHYAEELALRDGRRLPAMGILYRHMSHILREQNKLSEASYYAEEGVKICQQWGEKEALVFGLNGVARVKYAQGEHTQVEDLFRQILQIAGEISPRAVKQFRIWSLHYQLLQGKIETAEIWARDLELSPNDEFGYDCRYEYQNYAHLLVAKGDYTQALIILDGLVKVADKVGDGYFKIQYLVLQAIILDKLNKIEEAMNVMEKALSMARAEGFVRSILDEGKIVGDLLRKAIAQGIEVVYAGKLLAALGEESKPSISVRSATTGLMDPLSNREMEVMRLLVTDLTTPEIADELIVSVSTVRSHIKNIYAKLDVHSRYEAVSKAKQLDLL
jgi:LuxR family maltose regulon positive regulatory protein